MNGFAERYLKAEPLPNRKPLEGADVSGRGGCVQSVPSSPLLLVEQFLLALTSRDKDCRVVVRRGGETVMQERERGGGKCMRKREEVRERRNGRVRGREQREREKVMPSSGKKVYHLMQVLN